MQISATRHSSLISMVLTAGRAVSGAVATSSGGNTCDESVSEATTKGFGSSRLAFVPAFSTEALMCWVEAEPKPASQARPQLARARPATKLIRRCAFVANRHGSMIRPPKAPHEPDYIAKHATALILRTAK